MLFDVLFGLIGGILALHMTGMNFGLPAGFVALIDICMQNGVILITVFNNSRRERLPLDQVIREGM